MFFNNVVFLTSTEEPVEVLQYTTDDLYRVLSDCANSLEDISGKLDALKSIGNNIFQLLQDSFIDSLVALVFMLVCFEIIRLVRGWMKGVILNGRNR